MVVVHRTGAVTTSTAASTSRLGRRQIPIRATGKGIHKVIPGLFQPKLRPHSSLLVVHLALRIAAASILRGGTARRDGLSFVEQIIYIIVPAVAQGEVRRGRRGLDPRHFLLLLRRRGGSRSRAVTTTITTITTTTSTNTEQLRVKISHGHQGAVRDPGGRPTRHRGHIPSAEGSRAVFVEHRGLSGFRSRTAAAALPAAMIARAAFASLAAPAGLA